MVKLQKHKSYTYKCDSGTEIEHYKHTVVIPENTIQQLGWKSGMQLAVVQKGNSVILKPEQKGDEEE
jgi:hypothetical protein